MRPLPLTLVVLALTQLGAAPAVVPPARGPSPREIEFFEKKVRPILVSQCYACHSANTKPSGGLRVDDRNGLLTGGTSGPAIIPGQPEKSLLLRRIVQKEANRRMPREAPALNDEQVAILRQWIADGAAWPPVAIPITLGQPRPRYEKLKKEHWAWQPITAPKLPNVRDTAWPSDLLDRFILAKLEEKSLRPVGDADRVALLRRITFDLTGLPPTVKEIDAFLADRSPRAFEKVVDRLLASPAYGERWGRHWLDVVRYGESTGPSRNIPYPHAWRFRDYVIDSVNADLPFDRFLREQIAGDLLPAASDAERDRQLTATGLLALGVKDVNQRFKVRFEMDNVDEQIDVVTRGVLGLSVSCARCHDHKFDPIPTTDYYALAGIFTSTDNAAGLRNLMGGGGLAYYNPAMLVRLGGKLPEAPPADVAKLKARVEKAKAEWDAIRGTPEGLTRGPNGQPKQRAFRVRFEQAQAELNALSDPAARGQVVHGARDARKIANTEVRLRGEAEKLGPVVPRGYLNVFDVPGAPKIPANSSGRLELANWLTSPRNPLTARVIVNRVWQRLFDQGLVNTVDNFGVTGAPPSHPELLDHLATRFTQDGWSIKRLVRTLVLSRTYQLSAEANPAAQAVDPGNRLLWRHTPRRLDAEELRDAMLVASGTLNPSRIQGSPTMHLRMIEIRDNGPEAARLRQEANRSTHRSIYLPLVRGITPAALEAFDPVDQTLVTGQRESTNVPAQALFLLNSGFVRRQALTLASRLLENPDASPTERVQQIYRVTLGRLAKPVELTRALVFLAEYESAWQPESRSVARGDQPTQPKPAAPVPANPDEVDTTSEAVAEEIVAPTNARSAAWMALTQAILASAEFRYLQ
ncbi:MAG: PSD1 and planctomycete cytochrome C domain-containing protein [Gemmataceae bacterium]